MTRRGTGATSRAPPASHERLVAVPGREQCGWRGKVPGLAGISLLIDRDRGRAAVGALYADRDALVASRGAVAAVRGEATAKARATTRSLEEFEVVLATAVPHA
ncbi:hypothetical protein [Streptomyces sp. NPDC054849]